MRGTRVFTQGMFAAMIFLFGLCELAAAQPQQFSSLTGSAYFTPLSKSQSIFVASDTPRKIYVGLYATDGSTAGTNLLRSFYKPGGGYVAAPDLDRSEFPTLGRTALFNVFNAGVNELWVSNGTISGTRSIKKDFEPLLDKRSSAVMAGKLFFTGRSKKSGVLWRSNGTPNGTATVAKVPHYLAKNSRAIAENFVNTSISLLGDKLLFLAFPAKGQVELWKSDGTGAGTAALHSFGELSSYAAIFSSPSYDEQKTMGLLGSDRIILPVSAAEVEGQFPYDTYLYLSDGTLAGTAALELNGKSNNIRLQSIKNNPTRNEAFLIVEQVGSNPMAPQSTCTLFHYSGSGRQFLEVLTLPSEGALCSTETILAEHDGTIFFTKSQRTELWKSDGSPEGTVLIRNFSEEAASFGYPLGEGRIVSGTLLFNVRTDQGTTLWESNGTTEGTLPILQKGKPIIANSLLSSVVTRNKLLFSGQRGKRQVGTWSLQPTVGELQ